MNSGDDQKFLGVEIGGTKLQVAVGDAAGTVDELVKESVPKDATGEEIQEIILRLCRELAVKHSIAGVGVGFGGPVDVQSGVIARSHQVDGWENFPIRDWLSEQLTIPATVENDANVAALAEARLGAGAGCNPVFYVTLGSGVGGGLISNGTIYHGDAPGESELGHLRLSPGGETLESVCSGWALDRRLRDLAGSNPDGLLASLLASVPSGEAAVLPEAIAGGDTLAEAALAEMAQALAFGLSHVVHLAHPETIVIGGGLSHLGNLLLNEVQAALEADVMNALRPVPKIRVASFGEMVVPVGAILLAADQARPVSTTIDLRQKDMKCEKWISEYIEAHCRLHGTLPVDQVAEIRRHFDDALANGRQVFVCGNGGSAANASHFVTDLGKGASDVLGKRFRCMSLNDNTPWISALGNDYAYEDVFVRQLENFGEKGDILMVMSVSGNSPNVVKAVEWANAHGLDTIALVGAKGGKVADLAALTVKIGDTHFGRVEDAHMLVCHLLCYSYMEKV